MVATVITLGRRRKRVLLRGGVKPTERETHSALDVVMSAVKRNRPPAANRRRLGAVKQD